MMMIRKLLIIAGTHLPAVVVVIFSDYLDAMRGDSQDKTRQHSQTDRQRPAEERKVLLGLIVANYQLYKLPPPKHGGYCKYK